MTTSNLLKAASLAIAAGTLSFSVQAETILLADDFSGDGSSPLNGTAADVNFHGTGNWTSSNNFLSNGTVVDDSIDGFAFLGFNALAGTQYRFDAEIANPGTGWVALGFTSSSDFSTLFEVSEADGNGYWFSRHSNNGGQAWALVRTSTGNDVELFGGTNTTGDNAVGIADATAETRPLEFSILLDTTAATWTATYTINGTEYATLDVGSTDINGVGFSRDGQNASNPSATIGNFTLTQVPEPAALPLLALGGLMVARRRRA